MHLNIKESWSLKTKLTLFVSAIVLISIWSMAFYASRVLQKDMYQLLGEQQFTTASIVASQINQELDDRFKGLKGIAGEITLAMLSDTKTLQTHLEHRPVFQSLFNGGTFVTGIDGTAIADVPLSTGRIGTNHSDREWMIEALKGKSTVGKPSIGRKLHVPIFSMATPIRDAQGKVIGALAGVVDLSRPNFLDRLTENRYGRTGGYVLIAPQYRLVVTATDKSRIMTELPASGVNPFIDRHIEGNEGSSIFVNPLGVEILSSMKRIPLAGWYLSVVLPTAEAYAPIHKIQKRILLAAILLTLLAGGLTWWILRGLLSPLFSTVETLAAMTDSGQRPQPLPVVRHDEIGKLIGSFNDLLKTSAQREKAQIESEERYRSILNTSPDDITITDMDGRILMVSPAGVAMFGHDKESDGIGRMVTDFIAPEDRERVLTNFTLKVQGVKSGPDEYLALRRDGSTFNIEVNSEFIRDVDGKPINIVFVARDITERKQAEVERELLQEKLLQAQKMEAIGTLAGGIAHDFNNILSAILGYTEMARDANPPESFTVKNLEKVLEASHRAAALVKQILAFSRRVEIERISLQPGHIIKEAINLLRPSLPSTIVITQQIDTVTKPILADPTQLHQILVNLCTNAFHAMEQTGGTLEIKLTDRELSQSELQQHPEVSPGSFVMLTISDTGSGIAPEIWGRIFDPYFTTKGVGKGTGMGLSIVHGIVTRYGGFITSESNQGKGTVFRVYFPAIDKEMVPETKSVKAVPRGSERILFVDDETMLAELGKAMLEHLGYSVTVCTSSQDAWNTFKNQPDRFDAVVTDQTMPSMTGMDLAMQILHIRPDLPIILCTGYSTLIDENQAKAKGVKGFAMKPLSKQKIATLLRRVLDEDRLQG